MSDNHISREELIALGNIVSIARGTINPNLSSGERFIYYSIPGYDATGGALETLGKEIQSNKTLLENDCVLISKLNPRIPRVCHASISERGRTICSTEFIPLVPRYESVALEYLTHYLRSPVFQGRFQAAAGGSTNSHSRVTPGEILDWEVFIPPLSEQKKIAEILSGIDQELDRCNACLSRTNLLRTSLLKSMMKDAEEHSINHPLGNIVEVINGRAYKLTEWENKGTPVIRLQNLTKQGGNFYYSNLRLPEKQYCDKGDLLFMWSASFGPHIWWGDKAIYHYHIWKMVPRGDSILKNYLYLYLQYKTEEWKSQGSGMAMIHLTKEGIEKEVVPLPSVTAQEKVVYTMKSIDERITALKKKAGKYSLLKNAMSSDLFSGRKRVSI